MEKLLEKKVFGERATLTSIYSSASRLIIGLISPAVLNIIYT